MGYCTNNRRAYFFPQTGGQSQWEVPTFDPHTENPKIGLQIHRTTDNLYQLSINGRLYDMRELTLSPIEIIENGTPRAYTKLAHHSGEELVLDIWLKEEINENDLEAWKIFQHNNYKQKKREERAEETRRHEEARLRQQQEKQAQEDAARQRSQLRAGRQKEQDAKKKEQKTKLARLLRPVSRFRYKDALRVKIYFADGKQASGTKYLSRTSKRGQFFIDNFEVVKNINIDVDESNRQFGPQSCFGGARNFLFKIIKEKCKNLSGKQYTKESNKLTEAYRDIPNDAVVLRNYQGNIRLAFTVADKYDLGCNWAQNFKEIIF